MEANNTGALAPLSFNFQTHDVRILMRDEEPWFVAGDICDVLDLGNVTRALDRLDDDEKGVTQIQTLGGLQTVNIVSESGAYNLILRSDKPAAKPFSRWVRKEVLPSIRRDGYYAAPQVVRPGQVEALRERALTDEVLRLKDELLRAKDRVIELLESGQRKRGSGKHLPWTPDQEQQAMALRGQGLSSIEIGAQMGRNASSVAAKLFQLGKLTEKAHV